MRILVTGSEGFIGSTLTNQLEDKIIPFKSSRRIPSIDEFLKILEDIDVIIHLAGGGGNKKCIKDPMATIGDNILFTRNLIYAAKKNVVSQVIFASSIAIYTTFKKRNNPLKEHREPKPDDFYGSIKWCCEEIVKDIPYTILRLPNVYGIGTGNNLKSGGFINKVCLKVKHNKLITINNKSQSMDFVSVYDVVKAIKKSLLNKNVINETINIGSGSATSLLSIAEMINVMMNNSVKIIVKDEKVYANRYLDISKANKTLKWEPETNMQNEINRLLKNYDC
jgi:UDP-glucose 4-epimerase